MTHHMGQTFEVSKDYTYTWSIKLFKDYNESSS